MRNKLIIVIIVLLCIGLLRVYNSPDENHKYENDLQSTIKAGHWFSWLLFIGNKYWLLDQFDYYEKVKSKLKEADLQQVFSTEIIDKYEASGGTYKSELLSVLFTKPEDLELVALERRQIYTAMTFKLKQSLINRPNLPGKSGMVYSIAFRYYEPSDDVLWKKILRKIGNAVPFCSQFGTTGIQLVVDYSYTYDQNDYVTWFLQKGDSVVSKRREQSKDFIKNLERKEGLEELSRKVNTELAISDRWASAWVKAHTE